jgi:hypothetical protein
MRLPKPTFVSLSAVFLLTLSAAAQNSNSGNIAALEVQVPKPGMTQQYEQGRKQKADWHKQQKDTVPLWVFAVSTGEDTGDYLVGRLGMHWADFDNPPVPEAADNAEYDKAVAPYVQSIRDSYYEYMPKLSNPTNSEQPAKYTEIVTIRLRYGKNPEFESALTRVHDAVQKTTWPVNYEVYQLVNGGFSGTFVLAVPHSNWADFEDKPGVKPFLEMLKDAFGQGEADSIVARFDASIENEYSEILEFRPDLSYIPGK